MKPPKDLHQSHFKISEHLHQRLPKIQKYLHQSSENHAINLFKQVFMTIFENLPKKEPNFKVAKAKYWLPNGTKISLNGDKSPNLAALCKSVYLANSGCCWTFRERSGAPSSPSCVPTSDVVLGRLTIWQKWKEHC